jgi:ferredoxin
MTETHHNLSRRKFMLMSTAAIASPLLLDAASSTTASTTTETSLAKGTKIYFIGKECVGCQVCKTFCPAQAIRFGDCRDEIDQKKCIHCGTCYRECPVCVVSETVLS